MEFAGQALEDDVFDMLRNGVNWLARGASTHRLKQALSEEVKTGIARKIELYRRDAQLVGLSELPQRDDVVPECRATKASASPLPEGVSNPPLPAREQTDTARADSRASHEPARAEFGGATDKPQLDTAKISQWIEDEGYTNPTLATALHTTQRTVTSMRNNGRFHGADAVKKLANLMGCDTIDLYR
jgi:predicted XRE-type DNA-binding protein